MLRLCRTVATRSGVRMNSGVPERQPLHTFDNLFTGTNADYLDTMFESWATDRNSVSEELREFFEQATVTSPSKPLLPENLRPLTMHSKQASGTPRSVLHAMRVGWMLRLWAVRGHRLADLDPLKLEAEGDRRKPGSAMVSERPMFHPSDFGFSEEELDQVIHLAVSDSIGGFLALDQEPCTLKQLYHRLKDTYAGKIGWEYMHINDAKQLLWLRKRIETPTEHRVTVDHADVYKWLAKAEMFEKFLQIKFVSVKRFGLDGAEVLIPAIRQLLEASSDLGVENVVMGMPHRGRLNVLANVAGKPLGAIFNEFQGKYTTESEFGSGDVKYHLGFSETLHLRNGKDMAISLVANPSHLEAVTPVALGKSKAKQMFMGDPDQSKIMGVVMHGDASFAGQGVCFESMGLADLKEYAVGGTIHIIVNNQIGFTTDPISSRSTPYCSDLGKTFRAPVFHVNADATHEVIRVFRLAAEWRAKHKSDVIIDLVCYRRFGHNESDEPLFTQPLMYKKIAEHPTQLSLYADKLISEGLMTKAEIAAQNKEINQNLKDEFKAMASYVHKGRSARAEWLESFWTGFKSGQHDIRTTGVAKDQLVAIGTELNQLPAKFNAHPVVAKIIKARLASIVDGSEIDWSTAEQLAFGSLLAEGNAVRISGQDVERGTFSQRHMALHDQVTGDKLFPMCNLSCSKATATIVNSSLSEFGVLGFEIGYASEAPNQLVIWEAQFGDFANTAQVQFDTFLSSGEEKWYRQNGLVVNLPHGYDGAGPEHSSGRLERFLQMSDQTEDVPEDTDPERQLKGTNWQVCYPTSPHQYFHLLRRQVHRDYRKPLILFFAKSTLRAPNVSCMDDFTEDKMFQEVMDDRSIVDPSKVEKVVLCTGQVYFMMQAEREKRGLEEKIALVRVEQLAPFPWEAVKAVIERYPKEAVLQWSQEEPKNMGAWSFVEVRTESLLESIGDERVLEFNGRRPAAAPATGLKQLHDMENAQLLEKAMQLGTSTPEPPGMASQV